MKNSRDIIFTFRPDRPGLEKFFGKLEAEIMETLWASEPMTVKRALYFLNKKNKYAYTTIMTVMNRLTEKNILIREKISHSFEYQPALNKKEFLSLASDRIMSGLFDECRDIANKTFHRLRKTSRKK